MSDKKTKITSMCTEALQRIDDLIASHLHGEETDLSIPLLKEIRIEVLEMKSALNPQQFEPGYGRFLLDWPDQSGVVRFLMELDYQYGRLK